MLFKVAAIKRADSASIYFVDAVQLLAAPSSYFIIVMRLRESHRAILPWWAWVLICVAVGLRFTRIQLRRDAPRTVFLRNYWLGVVPGRTRERPLPWARAATEYEDSTRLDALQLGWENDRLWCFRPGPVAEWIEAQQLRLGGGLPVARTTSRDG